MRKPSNVIYGVDESPPPLVVAVSGLQHVALMSMYLLYPVLIAKAANAPPEVASAMVSLTLIALAVGAVVQIFRCGPLGSGYLCQPVPSIVYFVPSLIAAKTGGIPLVLGMTMAAGAVEMALSRVLRRLRPVFPPEVVGIVILLVGLASGFFGLRLAFGDARSGPVDPLELLIGLITLGLMIGFNIWGKGTPRIACVLLGMVGGYVAAALLGNLSDHDMEVIAHAHLLAFPSLGHVSWSFDGSLAITFLVAAVAATVKVIGNVTTAQKANDADWVRAGMTQVGRGVLSDGMSTMLAGAIGGHGLNSSTPAIGLATATGVLSRRVGYAIVAILFLLAFLPKLGALFYLMPRMVAASALVFSCTFIIVNGIQVMTSRLLDARKTLVIGLALLAGLAVDAQPGILRLFPDTWKSILGTSLVLGTLVGLGLNIIFRLGMRRTQSITIPLGPIEHERIEKFLQAAGESWGARVDVIERAKFNLVQSVETIMEGCDPEGPLEVGATFDEFNLDIRVGYAGPLLELPNTRPTNEEIMETEEGHRRLAGFMLRRFADRVSSSERAGRSIVTFHFDH
jgi:NCS2 family nucleobase:cation symporter-2